MPFATNREPLPTPGILVLRRACQNCTRAKRRCTVRLPKCERCASRNLACNYDLQPWTRNCDQKEPPAPTVRAAPAWHTRTGNGGAVSDEINGSCRHETFCWIDLATLPAFQDKVVLMRMDAGLRVDSPTHPAMQVTVDAETEAYLLEELRLMPKFAASGRITHFIHPQAKLGKVGSQIDKILSERNENGQVCKSFKELVTTNVAQEDLEGSLAAVQSLILYLALALNDMDAANRVSAEGLLPLLKKWIELLLISAREKMPRGLGPWRTWLLAESVRRTIVTGFLMGCAYQHIRQGFVWHKLFVESLPFDSRPELWAARSTRSWTAAAGMRVASEVGESLVSFHDFAVRYPRVSSEAVNDPFLRSVLVAHFGKRRVVDGII